MRGLDDFMAECDRGLRINELNGFFASTAAGKTGMPVRTPLADTRLLPGDDLLRRLVSQHAARQGHFDQHYHGSIPYRLEEECRMAHALLKYALQRSTPLTLYSLGTAEGTMARTLSELAAGHVQSLSCSPNPENYQCFLGYGEPPHAEFFLGPFHRLTKDVLATTPRLQQFASGFDVILEDTTFQMYSPNRAKQIEYVSQHLKPDGIFVFVEKFRTHDIDEYQRRERQKDLGFKTRYFPPDEIENKRSAVLDRMFSNEVSLAQMSDAIRQHFRYCAMTWNSGNFYSLAVSNAKENLDRYLSQMAAPAIPHEYVYDTDLPRDPADDVATEQPR